jgi:hypothetical protein
MKSIGAKGTYSEYSGGENAHDRHYNKADTTKGKAEKETGSHGGKRK